MNAIAGLWNLGSGSAPLRRCRAMLLALREYGPQASADAGIGGLAIGRNLHRLVPEDRFDRQPLTAGEGRFALVADARIDNRREIERDLSLGAEAAGMADSEILLNALVRWRAEAVDRLCGDFAFAFFDRAEQRLLLARDPLGQRPLFWHRGKGLFAFASMPKGLHADGLVARHPDPVSLARFLALVPQADGRSYFEGIGRVGAGELLVVTPSGERRQRYWRPRARPIGARDFGEHVEALRAQLDEAVACRLRRFDGNVGSHLSGGWDSGAVTATAAAALAEQGSRLHAFTAVPRPAAELDAPRSRFADEGPLAAATAASNPAIDHVLLPDTGRSPLADLDCQAAHFERPLFNLYNQVWLSQIRSSAKERGVSVLLTGELGNWTISAAPVTLLADLLRSGRWSGWAREAGAMIRQGRGRLRGVAAASFGPWLPRWAWKLLAPLSSLPPVDEGSLLRSGWNAILAPERGAQAALRFMDRHRRMVAVLGAADFGETRKGALALSGVDERDPTADRRLIDFCASLPLEMLMAGGVRRPLARAALSDRLPAQVLDEKGKGFQAVDWMEALYGDLPRVRALAEEIACDEVAAGLIDVDALRARTAHWPAGRNDPRLIVDYRIGLLDALAVGHFAVRSRGGDARGTSG